MVANFSFTPASVTAMVGDTIQWVRTGGTHTTTCDGSAMTSLPAGAPSWNASLTGGNPTFTYVMTVTGTYNYKCTPHAAGGMVGTITTIPASGIASLNGVVNSLVISPPTFKSDAVIKFSLSANAKVQLSIYDFAGRKLETLINTQLTAGEHASVWDAASIPQGIYFCRLESNEFVLTRKFVRVK